MIFVHNALYRFLEKITPTMAKGLILQLHTDAIASCSNEACLNEIKQQLFIAERDKKCQILKGTDNTGIFIYFPENHKDDIAALLMKIQFILGIPLTDKLNDKTTIYSLYHIKNDLKKLKELAMSEKAPPRTATTVLPKAEPLTPVVPQTTFSIPFTPALLASLEKSLRQADLSNLMRRQAVCALVGHAKPVVFFEEIYVALADLKKALCPTVDIYQSPWLLDRLLETLDKRVLENMTLHDAGAFRKNFSLNIAVKTILSPDFAQFSNSIDNNLKQSILMEIKLQDIFSNLPAFFAAQSFIKEQGYRLCIDMVTGDSLPLVQREKLGADFIKLLWTQELLKSAQTPEFIKALKANNPKHIILCHVDDTRAVDLGQVLGISLFQGYYIQKLLYQTPRK